jgi:hypothetical protein
MTDPRLRVLRRGADGAEDDQAILAQLDATTVRVAVADDADWSTQLLAETLVDLLGRVFPRIDVVCDATPTHPWLVSGGPALLRERLQAVRHHGSRVLAPGSPAVTVAVGPTRVAAEIYADGHGWQAYLGSQPSALAHGDADAVVFGPLTAACRAAGHAFSAATPFLNAPPSALPEAIYWSALDFSRSPTPLESEPAATESVLDAVLAGAGSVGGAAAYAWARSRRLSGRLVIADPQRLVDRNFDRALLATSALSASQAEKAVVAAEALAQLPGLEAIGFVGTLGNWVASRPRELPLPLTLCAVDSREARRNIQDCLPLDVINAACDPTNATVSGHRTGRGACVMCLFMAERMDAQQVRFRLIARATGLPEQMVIPMMAKQTPLNRTHVEGIEAHRGAPVGSLRDWQGSTLVQLYEGQLVYGGIAIETDNGAVVAVAAPWVTALAGFLLASETVKTGDPALAGFRLGSHEGAPGGHWQESPYGSPALGRRRVPPRWPGDACLCNSPRRRRLVLARYGLAADGYSI